MLLVYLRHTYHSPFFWMAYDQYGILLLNYRCSQSVAYLVIGSILSQHTYSEEVGGRYHLHNQVLISLPLKCLHQLYSMNACHFFLLKKILMKRRSHRCRSYRWLFSSFYSLLNQYPLRCVVRLRQWADTNCFYVQSAYFLLLTK